MARPCPMIIERIDHISFSLYIVHAIHASCIRKKREIYVNDTFILALMLVLLLLRYSCKCQWTVGNNIFFTHKLRQAFLLIQNYFETVFSTLCANLVLIVTPSSPCQCNYWNQKMWG
jgi:hypothetical protein